MATTTLFTIGYEKRSFDEYVAILRAADIGVVLDVRDVAWSHKRGFSKGGMTTGLAAAGIDYIHARFAGNPKRLRADAKDPAEMLARYREHLSKSPGILDELERLIGGYSAAGKNVALTCFERRPEDCHRGILAAAWARQPNRAVEHLGAEAP